LGDVSTGGRIKTVFALKFLDTQFRKDHLFELGVLILEPYLSLKIRPVDILLLLSCLPLFVLLLDGYYQKKLKKSMLLILLFVATVLTSYALLNTFGLSFALGVPVILFIVLAISIVAKEQSKPQK
jgi:hypothetical protein